MWPNGLWVHGDSEAELAQHPSTLEGWPCASVLIRAQLAWVAVWLLLLVLSSTLAQTFSLFASRLHFLRL